VSSGATTAQVNLIIDPSLVYLGFFKTNFSIFRLAFGILERKLGIFELFFEGDSDPQYKVGPPTKNIQLYLNTFHLIGTNI
jgi:hypothetical protein